MVNHLIAHLVVSNAAGFIDFCKRAFDAKELMRMPAGDKIMHAELQIGDTRLMIADEMPDMGSAMKSAKTLASTPVVLNVGVDDADAVWKQALSAGAKEQMPLADQFWGDRYGQLADPFGNLWAVVQPKEKLTLDEIAARAPKA